jgi:hypothetical protein
MATLPSQNEPLRLADGRVVYPGGDVVDTQAQERADREEQRILPARVRRKATDLPAPPQQMNTIATILAYVMYGLDDEEITTVTRLGTAVIARIKDSDPYKQMQDAIVRSALDQETDAVRDIITKNAKRAALTVVDSLDAGNRGDRMAAARDILDRSGLRPADVIEHRHRMDGGLVIEIVKRDDQVVPTIDMQPTEENE